jgi:GTP cyclohydrolase II
MSMQPNTQLPPCITLARHTRRSSPVIRRYARAVRKTRLGLDTVDANLALGLPVDARDYAVGAHILLDLGVRRIRLITNNPDKQAALAGAGVAVVGRVAVGASINSRNVTYLRTKQARMGHALDFHSCDAASVVSE